MVDGALDEWSEEGHTHEAMQTDMPTHRRNREIGKLTAELLKLVEPTEEEMVEQRLAVYEDMRDTDIDSVSDIDAVCYALDGVDFVLEEAQDHLRHGREEEAKQTLLDGEVPEPDKLYDQLMKDWTEWAAGQDGGCA